MRADSPGHSAKFGSYTMMDLKNNKVVDLQLVQSNEVDGSYHMELEGLKRSLELLKERGVTLDCIVTDRHLQIQKFLRESSITQFFDVWHIEKGISKQLEKAAKKKDCEKLRGKGECRAKPVKTDSTFRYVANLMDLIFNQVFVEPCTIHTGASEDTHPRGPVFPI
ncbi:hypothetical protein CgunFtcFv8_025073 [Champsocephalus gunnari]|uniref:Uncharacterized protein n=1 Tax=Champsocephalus gunnari TaxID=52237 RepID=A0AAN8DEM6_CHAGU|nr:hypothetical protein CgunFtcFv8_025073 [Champsocephalus gunnari]